MKDNRDGQHGSRNPVIRHPVELNAHLGQERGEQQREHGRRHDPVKQPRRQRVPGNAGGQLGRGFRGCVGRELLFLGEVPDVNRMHDEEQQSRDQRNPNQEPRDVDGNVLPQGLVAHSMMPMLPPARR